MSKVAITCGDPSGVGIEVIEHWWARHPRERHKVAIIGPQALLENLEGIREEQECCVADKGFVYKGGHPTQAGARVAYKALERAAVGCKEGQFNAVVTAPTNKQLMHTAGFNYPGQTEFFAHRWGGTPVMSFVGKKIRVVLATRHIPLKNVIRTLSEQTLQHAVHYSVSLAKGLGIAEPRVGVCGLNPHAGENTLIGDEEVLYNRWLEALRPQYPYISEMLPADSLFWRHIQGEFDVVVALYHDQGLIPLKTVDFDNAVHVTLGLPYVRTSPSHGTAYAIAGKGTANTQSFERAVLLAYDLGSHDDH